MLRIKTLFFILLMALLSACARDTHHYVDTKDVKIKSINHIKDGDFIVVTAMLENKDKDSIQHTVYRIDWFDKDGMLVEQSSWRPVIVKGGAPVYIKERSTVPTATEYTIVISNDAS